MSHEPGEAEPGRLHTSVLVGPEGELRKHRRARAQAAARLQTEARAAAIAAAKAKEAK